MRLITAFTTTLLVLPVFAQNRLNYPIVDTGVIRCYDNQKEISFPQPGTAFFGQDAHFQGNQPKYRKNSDHTVTDLITGLTWLSDPGPKMTFDEAQKAVKTCRVAGKSDWRIPTIKELYSLIQFTGIDPDPRATDLSQLKPFIDTRYFKFAYGDASKGERIIDSQFGTQTIYTGTTMDGNNTMFGVNFGDGRIKGYPITDKRRGAKAFYFLLVRGNPDYGKNRFKDQGKTITDFATGLTWMKVDSGYFKAGENHDGALTWAEALKWAESANFAGFSDWRLPNAKELQSLVDYTRSPQATQSPAIDPLFKLTPTKDEGGKTNYGCYWTSTPHNRLGNASAACYIAFGEALGWMQDRRSGDKKLMDVHGAGAQRSDPKSGDAAQFPYGRGPQGDVIRIENMVLLVRGGTAKPITTGPTIGKTTKRSRPRKPSF